MPRTRVRLPRGAGKQALIDATIEVIGERGLEGATVRGIADRAGVNNGLISHYFGTRTQLILAAIETIVERQLDPGAVTIAFALDPDARDAMVSVAEEDSLTQLFIYESVLAARRHPELRAGVTAVYDRVVQELRESLREHGLPDSEGLARAFLAILDGLQLQQLSITTPEAVSAAYDRLGALLRAAGAR